MNRARVFVGAGSIAALGVAFFVACNTVTGIDGYSVIPDPKNCNDCIQHACSAQLSACLGEKACRDRALCIQQCNDPNDFSCASLCIQTNVADDDAGVAMLNCALDHPCGPYCLKASEAGPPADTSEEDASDAGAPDSMAAETGNADDGGVPPSSD